MGRCCFKKRKQTKQNKLKWTRFTLASQVSLIMIYHNQIYIITIKFTWEASAGNKRGGPSPKSLFDDQGLKKKSSGISQNSRLWVSKTPNSNDPMKIIDIQCCQTIVCSHCSAHTREWSWVIASLKWASIFNTSPASTARTTPWMGTHRCCWRRYKMHTTNNQTTNKHTDRHKYRCNETKKKRTE